MTLGELAQEKMNEALALLECSNKGHDGLNISSTPEQNGFLCNRCMLVYFEDVA